jgi:tRNA uridine 5-carboxymethylaminomethyl modification enzyme
MARFKTGTPPRVDGRTVDFSKVERQDGDPGKFRFSAYARESIPEQRPCWITWTGDALREVVERNLGRSALYGGEISGMGPRYCPSIEDKIVRFPNASQHQVFLEPEGLDTTELYVNGLSTSLPPDVQLRFLRTIPGLEKAKITKVGYAIEYDYMPPHQLRHTLEVRTVAGLFFAGQINGTTGYEEAAGQGLVAGANAAMQALDRGTFVLERDEAYIGVLIDDLVTKGVDEPYRLFTSRAEFRLILRQDNAPARLGTRALREGLLTERQGVALERRLAERAAVQRWFQETPIRPEEINPMLEAAGTTPIREPVRAVELLRRPEITAQGLGEVVGAPFDVECDLDVLAAVEVELKYEGYVAREVERAAKLSAQAGFALREDLPYQAFSTLSMEARQKLERVRPSSLAQAARIPGVSPADLQNLMMEVRRHHGAAAV